MNFGARYEAISDLGDNSVPMPKGASHQRWWYASSTREEISSAMALRALAIVTIAVMGFLAGLLAGRMSSKPSESEMDWFSTPGSVDATFKYNRAFSMATSNDSEALWGHLFPPDQGFIRHPSLTKATPMVLSVFHQLHCLNSIRHGYYYSQTTDGDKFTNINPSNAHQDTGNQHNTHTRHDASPSHIRHCLDNLRQSLMCHVDTNMEPTVPELGGATGFGVPRKCRNYERVKAWAEVWGASHHFTMD
ncbi:protein of unknown function (DUF3328) domain containing protein [Rhypophila sp. PSN 637]